MTRVQLRWLLRRPWGAVARVVFAHLMNERVGSRPITTTLSRLAYDLQLELPLVDQAAKELAAKHVRGHALVHLNGDRLTLVLNANGGAAEELPKPKKAGPVPRLWEKGATVPDTWIEWAEAKFPSMTRERLVLEAEDFADYWSERRDAKAKKLSWERTWQGRIRRLYIAERGKPWVLVYDEIVAHLATGRWFTDPRSWAVWQQVKGWADKCANGYQMRDRVYALAKTLAPDQVPDKVPPPPKVAPAAPKRPPRPELTEAERAAMRERAAAAKAEAAQRFGKPQATGETSNAD